MLRSYYFTIFIPFILCTFSGQYCIGSANELSSCHSLPDCEDSIFIKANDCPDFIKGSRYGQCGPSCPRTCDDLQVDNTFISCVFLLYVLITLL